MELSIGGIIGIILFILFMWWMKSIEKEPPKTYEPPEEGECCGCGIRTTEKVFWTWIRINDVPIFSGFLWDASTWKTPEPSIIGLHIYTHGGGDPYRMIYLCKDCQNKSHKSEEEINQVIERRRPFFKNQ